MALNELQLEAIQEDISDTRTKKERIKEQMEGLKTAGRTARDIAIESIPGVSEEIATKRIDEALQQGDTTGAIFEGAAAAAGMFPLVGDAAGKLIRAIKPKKTVKAYKLFTKGKDGNLYPLFVDADTPIKQGEFISAVIPDSVFTAPNGKKYVPSRGTSGKKGTGDSIQIPDDKTRQELIKKGFLPEGSKAKSVKAVALRPGWHSGDSPAAPHIGNEYKGQKYRGEDQVWAEVEIPADVNWQEIADANASIVKSGKRKGLLNVSEAQITDKLPSGGYYRYKTNPNMQGNWLISGEMKVNRILDAEEVKKLNKEAGVEDLPTLSELKSLENAAPKVGYNVNNPVFHGTKKDFTRVNLVPEGDADIGFHVGTAKQAENRLPYAGEVDTPLKRKEYLEQAEGARVLKLALRENLNPLRIPDMGAFKTPKNWLAQLSVKKSDRDLINFMLQDPDDAARLANAPRVTLDGEVYYMLPDVSRMDMDEKTWKDIVTLAHNESRTKRGISDLTGSAPSEMEKKRSWFKKLKETVNKNGYDSFVYKNEYEGPFEDADSYMLLEPDQVKGVFGGMTAGDPDLMKNKGGLMLQKGGAVMDDYQFAELGMNKKPKFASGGLSKQMELFEGGDLSTAKDNSMDKLDSGVEKLRADRKKQFDKMTEMLASGEVNDMTLEQKENFVKLYKMLKQHHNFAKGGMLEDGGLLDEGGMIDEESGNEVPPGSTREEVRDDIPAQLSEGEFVFPADVVRFIGLEKLMKMRQQAKMGLRMMEAMGQMGNSEEAVMPDDLPFDINDLDIEEENEYNYQVGGFVPPQGSGIAGYQQSQFANYQPTYTPYSMAAMQPTAPTYQVPQQQYVPTMQVPVKLPTFEQFTTAPEGIAPQNREYINPETGERRIFTFIGGNPTTAIPEGFIPISEYTEPEPVTTTPTVGQARVVERGDKSQRDAGMDGTPGATFSFGGKQNQKGTISGAMTGTISYSGVPKGYMGTMSGLAGLFGMDTGISLEGDQTATLSNVSVVDGLTEVDVLGKQTITFNAAQFNKLNKATVTSKERKELEDVAKEIGKVYGGLKTDLGLSYDQAKDIAEAMKEMEKEEKAYQEAIAKGETYIDDEDLGTAPTAPSGDKDTSPSTGGTDTTGETDTGGSPSAGGGSEPEGPDSTEGPGGSSCFAAGTKFIMEDGTTKNIEDIKIGDKLKLGGRVYSTIQGDGLIETWYNYGTTKVTGNHAIFENGEWKRVKDAEEAIPALHKEEILYTLINENHRMVAEDGVVYTDYDEVDNTGIEEDLLVQLNGQNAEATAA